MTITSEIITRAFRKIAVASVDEPVQSESADEGLEALNMMLHGWKLRGVDITHADLVLTDTFPLASEYEEGTVYLLAQRLSPNYVVPANFDADDWFRAIQAAYAVIAEVTMPPMLLKTSTQVWRS